MGGMLAPLTEMQGQLNGAIQALIKNIKQRDPGIVPRGVGRDQDVESPLPPGG